MAPSLASLGEERMNVSNDFYGALTLLTVRIVVISGAPRGEELHVQVLQGGVPPQQLPQEAHDATHRREALRLRSLLNGFHRQVS